MRRAKKRSAIDMNLEIRDYRESDYEACRGLWVQLTEQHRKIYDDPTIGGNNPGRHFDEYLASAARQKTWVAEAESVTVGMAGLMINGEEGEVEPVVVAEGFRSRGVGSALIGHAISAAKGMGVRFLSVRPLARNVEALRFFIEKGFNLVGYVDLFQDLQPGHGRRWKPGISIHGNELRY